MPYHEDHKSKKKKKRPSKRNYSETAMMMAKKGMM